MLEQDPTDVMVDVMIFFANNWENATRPSYVQSPFEASRSAVAVNCLFFASLSISLVAALASVVALQWVTDYDTAVTRGGSSPEDRAKRRQLRHAGVLKWRMGDIIAAIPLLLYSSVAIFFSGLILWMQGVHYVVGMVVLGGAIVAVIFYAGTTLLAVLSGSAPFRTPLSRVVYATSHLPFSALYFFGKAASLSLIYFCRIVWREANVFRYESRISLWLKEKHLEGIHFDKRDDRRVQVEPKLGLDATMWLANQLNISQVSFSRLFLLVAELPRLEREISFLSGFGEPSPWGSIFDLLGQMCFKKDPNEHITATEMRIASTLAKGYNIPKIKDIVDLTVSKEYGKIGQKDGYWEMRNLPKLRLGGAYRVSIPISIPMRTWSEIWCPNNLILFLREVASLSGNNDSDLEAAIRRARLRNWYEDPVHWVEMFDQAETSPSAIPKESIMMLSRYLQVAAPRWWARMAAYLMDEYQGPYLSSILDMQSSAWYSMLDPWSLYRWARKESSLFVSNNLSFTSLSLMACRSIYSTCVST